MERVEEVKYLHVSECFYSIQGEGTTTGIPAVFLRLSGCNLLCSSLHWVCDTIPVWRKGVKTAFADVLSEDFVDRLRRKAHLVFTGGEPMLHEQAIQDFLIWFKKKHGFFPIVEVETNGTIVPNKLEYYVDFWNVSPKLSNSGEPREKRYNNIAIHHLNHMNHACYKVMFKFVISSEADFEEILQDYSEIDMTKVVLMPAGSTQAELEKTRPLVVELCKKTGMRYSDRLHIVIWNKKTGV